MLELVCQDTKGRFLEIKNNKEDFQWLRGRSGAAFGLVHSSTVGD